MTPAFEARRKQGRELLSRGMSLRDVAAVWGVSKQRVSSIVGPGFAQSLRGSDGVAHDAAVDAYVRVVREQPHRSLNIRQIAGEIRVPVSRVAKRLKDLPPLRVTRPPWEPTPRDLKMSALWLKHLEIGEVAKAVGASRGAVSNRIHIVRKRRPELFPRRRA